MGALKRRPGDARARRENAAATVLDTPDPRPAASEPTGVDPRAAQALERGFVVSRTREVRPAGAPVGEQLW